LEAELIENGVVLAGEAENVFVGSVALGHANNDIASEAGAAKRAQKQSPDSRVIAHPHRKHCILCRVVLLPLQRVLAHDAALHADLPRPHPATALLLKERVLTPLLQQDTVGRRVVA